VEIRDGPVLRFVCHTGHQFTADSLLEGKTDDVESALWSALRALKEKADLTQRMIDRARDRGDVVVAGRYSERVAALQKQVAILRGLIERM
jgi:two-component system chemotaxis response regulator CheB